MWLPVMFRAQVLDHWPQPAIIPHISIGTTRFGVGKLDAAGEFVRESKVVHHVKVKGWP